jgi:odorant receptor
VSNCNNHLIISLQVTDDSAFIQMSSAIIPMVIQLFLPFFFGSELSFASSKLLTALFGSEWIECDKEIKSTMKIFMENAKKEIKISAFNVFHVNLPTFTAIINSAYSLYAVLMRFHK